MAAIDQPELPRLRAGPRPGGGLCAGAAFTLMEVLVVIGIISIFVGVVGYGFMRGSASATVGMQSAQSTLGSLLTQARSQAAFTGRETAVLVAADTADAERYCRYLVPVVRDAYDTVWEPLSDGVYLPRGCYIVPRSVPTGDAVEDGSSWVDLNSTALGYSDSGAINSSTAASWIGIRFLPRGTTATNGQIVVATGRPNPAGSASPVRFTNPANVRGVKITSYGVVSYVNEPAGF